MEKRLEYSPEDLAKELKLSPREKVLWYQARENNLIKDAGVVVCMWVMFALFEGTFIAIDIGIAEGVLPPWPDVGSLIGGNIMFFSILFICFGLPAIFQSRNTRLKKQRLHQTPDQLRHYLTARVLTDQRWIQKDYDHQFQNTVLRSMEEQYPEIVQQEEDIVSVLLTVIRAVGVQKGFRPEFSILYFHCNEELVCKLNRQTSCYILNPSCLQVGPSLMTARNFGQNLVDANTLFEILQNVLPLEKSTKFPMQSPWMEVYVRTPTWSRDPREIRAPLDSRETLEPLVPSGPHLGRVKFCPKCAQNVDTNEKFCPNCGQNLTGV